VTRPGIVCDELMSTTQLSNPNASVFVPDGSPSGAALARTTHLAIGAHPDDIPIMAFQGIAECYRKDDRWFTGVTVTNGSGTPRSGPYSDYSDSDMREVRRREEESAAAIGEYSAAIQLDYTSGEAKTTRIDDVVDDLTVLIAAMRPQILYTHNPADRHDTHVAATLRSIAAVRRTPMEARPKAVYGCEVWRDLDWLIDDDKIVFDVSEHADLGVTLVKVYESQIAGGKRYDLATQGRRLAHATFSASHRVDRSEALLFAMDLTPLMTDSGKDIQSAVLDHVERLQHDIAERIDRMSRGPV